MQELSRFQMMKTPELLPLTKDPHKALEEAPSLDDLFLQYDVYDSTIYYAFLKEELARHPELTLNTEEEITELDKEIIKDLYQNHYDYLHMMKIMTTSPAYLDRPNFQDDSMRWLAATIRVAIEVNPVLDLPAIKHAQSPHEMKAGTEAAYYRAGLKAILQRKPSLRLTEADPLVAKMLLDSGHDKRFVFSCLEQSPEFFIDQNTLKEMPIEKADATLKERRKAIDACIEQGEAIKNFPKRRALTPIEAPKPEYIIPEEKDLPPMPDPETFYRSPSTPLTEEDFLPPPPLPEVEPEQNEEDFYQKFITDTPIQPVDSYEAMRKQLLLLRDSKKNEDLVHYWADSMKLIRDALVQIDQQRETCKALYAWAGGILKGERELALGEDAEVAKAFAESKSLLQKLRKNAELQVKELEEQVNILDRFDTLSKRFLTKVVATVQENPLLKLQIIQEAEPFKELLKKKDVSDDALYASALRQAALDHPCKMLKEGDQKAAEILLQAKLSKERISAVLLHSPRLQQMEPSEQKEELAHLLSSKKEKNVAPISR